jgi:uncharacterized protein YprB with RNaseH-like and TPR domain
MKIGFFDGEMTGLNADGWSQMLCACICEYQPVTARNPKPWCNMRTFLLTDYTHRRWEDRGLALAWRDALEEYDLVVGWNTVKFDVPYLNTRLQEYDCRPLRLKMHKDLMYTARFKLKLDSASLENVSTYLRVHEKYGIAKTKLEKKRWRMAIAGHRPSYEYICRHCEADVKVLAAVWQETKHLVTELK